VIEARMIEHFSPAAFLGRDRELSELLTLVRLAREGRSGTLVVTGAAGIGKTALLDRLVGLVGHDMRVVRMVAAESEMELTYAGLQLLCGSLMPFASDLPAPEREALEAAFGLRGSDPPSPLVLSLAVRDLLTRAAGAGAVLCIVDDAQWLDDVSARTIASVARRLSGESVALVMASRREDPRFDDLPHLVIEGLADHDARALLHSALPGSMDERVADQLIVESRGNPLALRELPRSLSRSELAGGFALASSIPLENRIEKSLLAQLEPLPAPTRTLLLLAAADPTGDTGLLWRAGAILGLAPENLDLAQQADALTVSGRVSFRHPLIRSAVYRSATPAERRAVHAALADATYEERDPDRRAWHRASATVVPDEEVAGALVRSADRARARGGVAASAAFLERAAGLTPDPDMRADRVLAAAEAKLDAGSAADALRLLGTTRDLETPLQEALAGRLRARAMYTLRRDRSAPRQLLRAAQALEPHDAVMARDTYMLALTVAIYASRLGEPGATEEIAQAVLAATASDRSPTAGDLILRGQALLCSEGPAAARSTVRRAIRAFQTEPVGPSDLQRMWIGGRAAQDVWDADGLRTLAERQVQVARSTGVLTVLPMALNLLMVVRTFDGDLDEAERICDEIDAMLLITGHPLPPYGRIFIAAYRGRVEEVERRAAELRTDAHARGEGYALTVANMAEALVYNGAGRYQEALASARGELPYAHELGHAMRTLLELIEAASRTGEQTLAEEALEQLSGVTPPAGESDWADAVMSLAQAQLREGDEAERLYRQAIELFDRIRVPMLRGRSQLLYGEMLRRQGRRVDARAQLRAAFDVLTACGMTGFADRAQRELKATGEKMRPRSATSYVELTDQELNVARLAREGLTNREIGARLFISAHTVDWHLRKVFTKLAIKSRNELHVVLPDPQ
jgi:DNA-binding CsgD family transcriptional regulator/tetratricopeptide (TPR) repeat protein